MARILVVDDDKAQTMSLAFALAGQGHTIEMATSPLDAVADGLRFRPDFVVTDWLLGPSLDGIRLATALRAATPTTHAFLVTSFFSTDLRQSAIDARLSGLFEKPLELAKITSAITTASKIAAPPPETPVGVVEYRNDDVLYVNSRAKLLLGLDTLRPDAPRLDRLVGLRGARQLDRAKNSWVELVRPDLRRPYFGFPLRGGSGRTSLLLVLGETEEALKTSEAVETIIRAHSRSSREESRSGRILVVDRDDLQRRVAATQLRLAGWQYHTAETPQRAKRLLEADKSIDVVIVDWETPDAMDGFVRDVRRLRPKARLIGTSTQARRSAFEEMGVADFLLKPVLASSIQELGVRK